MREEKLRLRDSYGDLRGHPTNKMWFFFHQHYIFIRLQEKEVNLDRKNNYLSTIM